MEKSTQQMLRNGYFLGIVLLAMNALAVTRSYLGGIFDMQIMGFRFIEIIAMLTAIGAFFAYKRMYI